MNDSELLKQTRQYLGLNQTQMAKRLGYGSQVSISKIETGVEKMSGQARTHLMTIRKYELGQK